MKKLLVICLVIAFLSAFAGWATAAEWGLLDNDPLAEPLMNNDSPLTVHILQPNLPDKKSPCFLTGFDHSPTGLPLAMVPLTMEQLKLTIIDMSPETDTADPVSDPSPSPRIELNAGMQAEKFVAGNDINLSGNIFGEETDWQASTVFLFFGVDFDLGQGYFQSNAFMGHSPENQTLAPPGETLPNGDANVAAKGFNALAGYKLSDRITLEAGCGYLEQDNKNAGTTEEAFAIYAHAILSLAPGLQVKPGIGQIDFEKTPLKGKPKDDFYAGAQWEINF